MPVQSKSNLEQLENSYSHNLLQPQIIPSSRGQSMPKTSIRRLSRKAHNDLDCIKHDIEQATKLILQQANNIEKKREIRVN